MNCSRFPCGMDSTGHCAICNPPRPYYAPNTFPFYLPPTPSPRTLPVNIPFPNIGLTVVTLDSAGNVTIKVDQPSEAKS